MVEELIKKAGVLVEALPYIQAFRGQIVVIKFGGSAMEVKSHAESILADVAFMECVGMRPVLVHGGGKAISREMKQEGIEPNFVKGLRVTCEDSIRVVHRVMKEEINPGIVASLERFGARAKGIPGEDIFRVSRKTEVDPETGETIDWGYVGEPSAVNTEPILRLLAETTVPVIPPIGIDEDGRLHNINADTAAAAVAAAFKARKLVYLSDVPGLLRNTEEPSSLISTLVVDDIDRLIQSQVIGGGMLPKVESGIRALKAGVRKVHMIDGRMPHSLLLEIFTDEGVGTEIIADR